MKRYYKIESHVWLLVWGHPELEDDFIETEYAWLDPKEVEHYAAQPNVYSVEFTDVTDEYIDSLYAVADHKTRFGDDI